MERSSNGPIGLLLVGAALLISACATTAPMGVIQTQEVRTLGGMPVRITRIALPPVVVHKDVQAAAGSVWATAPGMFSQHTIRVDEKTNQVSELPRPFTTTGADLLVDEHAMWLADTLTKLAGRGDLSRIDLASNKTIATIEAVGTPFATGDGAVWAYNRYTGVVTGIDIKDNRVRTKIATQGGPYGGSLAFGAGSLWQFAFEGDVTAMQLARGVIPQGVVRRIDPRSGKVIAETPLGPYRPTDRINFIAGGVWMLGERGSGVQVATRINVETNRIATTITLPDGYACTNPRTPVLWKGAVWLSTVCRMAGGRTARLLKIDLDQNKATDQIVLSQGLGPLAGFELTAGEAAIWGFDGRSARRFDF